MVSGSAAYSCPVIQVGRAPRSITIRLGILLGSTRLPLSSKTPKQPAPASVAHVQKSS